MSPCSSLKKITMTLASATITAGGLTIAMAAPAQAAYCTVNIYRLDTAKGGDDVYVSYSGQKKVYKEKHNALITGPNSNVMNPTKVNERRAIYLANGRLAWMDAPALEYEGCR